MIVDDQIGSLFLTYIIQVVARQRPAGGFMEYKETGLVHMCWSDRHPITWCAPADQPMGPEHQSRWVGAARGENSEFPIRRSPSH